MFLGLERWGVFIFVELEVESVNGVNNGIKERKGIREEI